MRGAGEAYGEYLSELCTELMRQKMLSVKVDCSGTAAVIPSEYSQFEMCCVSVQAGQKKVLRVLERQSV